MMSDEIPGNVLRFRPRPETALPARVADDQGQPDQDIDAVRAELREVSEQLRRAGRKLAAIEAMEGIDSAAIKTATTHVRLLCRPSGYGLEEADEPPPTVGEHFDVEGEAFVVDRFAVSPFPADSRRCAILVMASPATPAPDVL
jgi:hypothetical protein